MRTNLPRSERLKEKKERLKDRKERLRSYRKWTLGNILGDLDLRRADGGRKAQGAGSREAYGAEEDLWK